MGQLPGSVRGQLARSLGWRKSLEGCKSLGWDRSVGGEIRMGGCRSMGVGGRPRVQWPGRVHCTGRSRGQK